ncbi:ATP-binding protein [Desulfurivibrio alkaliphilus]|uniref:ATPase protein n=1 Tax=Desulfurivibrio alkaliphilus (strain DSM 19089 / UNIQEM U267 / AHT2) TaxID=589865 RepID=D6Z3H6_DESAT|nr:ATP-binding protein [Desulfurivibrio alkaliphilus]ADH86101.1 ATPase protein [Desulfurivibrio alkaliphilus AHT 2]
MAKKRALSEKIDRLLAMFPVVAVIGPRQCGKSTLVQDIRPDWKYYDLERPDDYQLITSDPLGFFSRQTEKTIIDEAQQFPDLFKVLRGVIDQDREEAGRFILTGSSSPEIVKGLAESLAGRIATVELWPFKGSELHERPLAPIYHLLTQKGPDLQALANLQPVLSRQEVDDQWLLGGYPEPRIKGANIPDFHGLWMDEYFSDYIRRDIGQLFPRINRHTFRLFIQSLSFQSGNILNRSEIARALEISSVTVKEYLDILHNTFIWRNLPSYEKNRLKKVQKMPKGFFRDQGILHHLLKIHDLDSLLVHPAAGNSFEAFVIEEIVRGFQCTLTPGLEFHFYRTRDKAEIDLIIDGPFGIIPIEVKLGHQINRRSLTALRNFLADTGADIGIVVNNSEKIEFLADNILQIPARYF